MVVGGADEARARLAPFDARVQYVARADFERGGIERFATIIVQDNHETAQLVILERLDYIRRILDRDRRAFFGDLQIVAAVGGALDALAEQQSDSRVVDPLVVAVPVAVASKRDFPRFDGIEARPRHYFLFLTAIEDDRHRTVVNQIHFHRGAELARFNFNIASSREREKMLIEAARFGRPGGFGEGWPPA